MVNILFFSSVIWILITPFIIISSIGSSKKSLNKSLNEMRSEIMSLTKLANLKTEPESLVVENSLQGSTGSVPVEAVSAETEPKTKHVQASSTEANNTVKVNTETNFEAINVLKNMLFE